METPVNESNPERYLREIRDLQKQNTALLQELVEQKRSEVRWQHWKSVGRVILILLPYVISSYAMWLFYTKVQESISSITNAPKNTIENINSGTKQFWNTRNEIINATSEKTDGIIENVKSYFSH